MKKNVLEQTHTIVEIHWQSIFVNALKMFILLTGIFGVLYPLTLTGISQSIFPHQANGSLVTHNEKVVGSALIGQDFSSGAYFQSRPSATADYAYNAAASAGTNLAMSHPLWKTSISDRTDAWKNQTRSSSPVPVDLVSASASGLDPHISEEAAYYQAALVAQLRELPEETIHELIARHVHRGITTLTPYVNVLEINLALDALTESNKN